MSKPKTTIEIFLAVNECGDWQVGEDAAGASELLQENYGISYGLRVIKLYVNVTLPEYEEVSADVPDEVTEPATAEVVA
jgi:hypothetical protein